jgi:hypothetical protein
MQMTKWDVDYATTAHFQSTFLFFHILAKAKPNAGLNLAAVMFTTV